MALGGRRTRLHRVQIAWGIGHEPDPRIERTFTGIRGEAVVPAVVNGRSVYVTAVEEHYDCEFRELHTCVQSAVQVWDATTGELVRSVPLESAGRLAVIPVGGRTLAVSRPLYMQFDPPLVVDLDAGCVTGPLPGHVDTPVHGLTIATTPDGPAVVSVTADGIVRVVSPDSGAVRRFDSGARDVTEMAMVCEGTIAALGGDDVVLWDLDRGERIGVVRTGRVRGVVSWPDATGLFAVCGADDTVTIWDAGSGRQVGLVEAHPWIPPGHYLAGVVGPGGQRVLAVSDGEAVHLWDVDAGMSLGPPLVGPTHVCAVAADGDGRLVTVSWAEDGLAVWRVASAPPRGEAPAGDLRCVAVEPGGRILTGGNDGVVAAWRVADGRRDHVLATLPSRVNAIATLPPGNGPTAVAVGGDLHRAQDDLLHRWFGDGPDQPVPLGQGGEARLIQAAVVDGRPVALTSGPLICVLVHDLLDGDILGHLHQGAQTRGLAVGELAGRPVAAVTGLSPVLGLWDLATLTPIETPLAETAALGELVYAVIGSPEGPAVVLVVDYHQVVVRGPAAGVTVTIGPDDGSLVTALAARDDALAVARIDGTVSVHRLPSGDSGGTLTLRWPATALAWTTAGELVIASRRELLLAHCDPVMPTG